MAKTDWVDNTGGTPVLGVDQVGAAHMNALGAEVNTKVTSGGPLGTPGSGDLRNCGNLPVTGIADSTTATLGVGALEVGSAATTVTELEPGLLAVENVGIPTITGAKRIVAVTSFPSAPAAETAYIVTGPAGGPRVATIPSSATPTFLTDLANQAEMLNLVHNITTMTFSGIELPGQIYRLVFKSAAAQTISSWGPDVIDGPAPLLDATIANRYHEVLLKYNSTAGKWVCMASDAAGYVASVSTPTPAIFVGDYSTGNPNQYTSLHTKYGSFTPPSLYPGGQNPYPFGMVFDATKGIDVARYEVRTGDVFAGGERCECRAGFNTGGLEGQVRWYKWSTKFDSTYPTTWGTSDWAVVNQWHTDDSIPGSPQIGFGYTGWNGHIGSMELNSKAQNPNVNVSLWHTPISVGNWHDMQMEIKWSETAGYINLWRNGVAQTFDNGATTWSGPTMAPGANATGGSYYKEGLYRRDPTTPTGIVYHTGFKCAATQAGLA